MAIQQIARATGLAWTAVAGQSPTPPSSPLSHIQSWSLSTADALEQFLKGSSRVPTSYAAQKGGSLTIETADLAIWSAFRVGQRYTNVILTVEGARDSANAAVGGNITITLSEAVITELGELSHGNENSAPVVASVTFALDRHAASSADPTIAIAEVV